VPDTKAKRPPIFLETTVQISRVIGTEDKRSTIRQNTRNRILCTSGHVLGEYNRSLVHDAITFRDVLRTSPSVGEAGKRMREKYGYRRVYGRAMDLIFTVGRDGDKQTMLDRLEDFIDFRAHEYFWGSIEKGCFEDKVQCVLKDWRPEQDASGEYDTEGLKCRKNNPRTCEPAAFMEKHREKLEAVVSEASGHNRKNITKAAQALRGILDGKDVPYGERGNCYTISDTLIVLEAPDESEVYSTDGDVAALCQILGQPLFTSVAVATTSLDP